MQVESAELTGASTATPSATPSFTIPGYSRTAAVNYAKQYFNTANLPSLMEKIVKISHHNVFGQVCFLGVVQTDHLLLPSLRYQLRDLEAMLQICGAITSVQLITATIQTIGCGTMLTDSCG